MNIILAKIIINMDSNKFTSQIKKYARQMNEALNRKDFDTYEILKNLQE